MLNNSGIPWRPNSTDDALAIERHVAFRIGVFSDPLYTTGDSHDELPIGRQSVKE